MSSELGFGDRVGKRVTYPAILLVGEQGNRGLERSSTVCINRALCLCLPLEYMPPCCQSLDVAAARGVVSPLPVGYEKSAASLWLVPGHDARK